jgi:hypothetical protein
MIIAAGRISKEGNSEKETADQNAAIVHVLKQS